jgi:DNA uptake protein ComE-like DNA-binding protein
MLLKIFSMLMSVLLLYASANAQEESTEAVHENSLENSTSQLEEQSPADFSDQSGWNLQGNISINSITHEQLSFLGILSVLQIHAFLWYRELNGPFISILELQAIPYWTPDVIRQLLPLLRKGVEKDRLPSLKQQWREGTHTFIFRTGKAEKITGINAPVLLPRMLIYRFRFRNLMQWGLTFESDAGENLKPDHVSGFIKVAGKSLLKQFIAGDFTVNMGQGLIHWQGFAIGATGVLNSYRQGEMFRPHTGRDENRYHRGLALSIGRGKWEFSVFGSYKPVDANLLWDSLNSHHNIQSFPLSGLHRTEAELAVRKTAHVGTMGSKIALQTQRLKISFNSMHVDFEHPVFRRYLPYNQFKQKGRWHTNTGLETILFTKTGLFFSEWAIDRYQHSAMAIGWIRSINKQLDLSIHYRNHAVAYQAWQSDCFNQSGEAGNERGLFLNMTFSPFPGHRIEAFSDVFSFPWVRALTDAPSHGSSSSVYYSWKASKKAEWIIRWQQSVRWNNTSNFTRINSELEKRVTSRLRVHLAFIPADWLHLRVRHELAFVNTGFLATEKGSLSYFEFILKPTLSPFSLSMRYSLFDSESYLSRIYAYERDVPSYQTIPAFYNEGNRLYVVCQWKWKKALLISGKWLTDFRNSLRTSDWRLQMSWQFAGER